MCLLPGKIQDKIREREGNKYDQKQDVYARADKALTLRSMSQSVE